MIFLCYFSRNSKNQILKRVVKIVNILQFFFCFWLLTLSVETLKFLYQKTPFKWIRKSQNHTHTRKSNVFFFSQSKHQQLHSPSAVATTPWICYHCGKKILFWVLIFSATPQVCSHLCACVCALRYAFDSSWFAWQHILC